MWSNKESRRTAASRKRCTASAGRVTCASWRIGTLVQLRHVAAMGLLFGPGSCCEHPIVKPDYRPVTTTPPGMTWIGPITLIGDDQKFHIGNHTFLFRSGFTDRHFSNSAVRVPQQDLFGDSLLGLAAMGSGIAVHLGDAMDLACADEWQGFERIMKDGGRAAWFWTPGNHDGFFFGNFVGPMDQWRSACHPSQPMTKAAALQAYVVEHLAAYTGTPLDPMQGTWSCPSNTGCNSLLRVAWQIRPDPDFYKSYAIQEIDVPRPPGAPAASLILIDTATYDHPPRIAASEPDFHYAAGEHGHVGAAQLGVLKQWATRAAGEGRAVVLAGHHPFDDLDADARQVIDELVSSGSVMTYISAHTHWGQYFTHTGATGYSWLEPNLGSIIDYDSEFGTLSLGFHDNAKFVRMTRTSTSSFTTGARADLGIECKDPEWFARPDDVDFYTRYMTTTSPVSTTIELLYYSTMLGALDRYWRCVPTVPEPIAMPEQCISHTTSCHVDSEVHAAILETLATQNLDQIRAKALELLALDQHRNVEPCLRREYRVCQSLWAAEYEKREYVTPVRGEEVFEVHTVHGTSGSSAATR